MTRKLTIDIAGRPVGDGAPCFVIAEAGVNHNGSVETAKHLAAAAHEAGADAVKFQTFHADKVISPQAPKAAYQKEATGGAESQLEMVRKLELPAAAFRELSEHCRRLGIIFLSTAFDDDSVDELAALGVPAFKVPSGEITNLPFLEHIARQNKPVILSTGMAEMDEVRSGIAALRGAGNKSLVLLHCVSNYPASPGSVNLRAMAAMREAFGLAVGYSDHTLGIEIAIAAVALGACVIEKHLTLDGELPGPDHKASLEPAEFSKMVRGIRAVEAAMGDGNKRRMPEEEDVARVARRSLVAACAVSAGTVLTAEHIAILRPGTGMPPAMRGDVIGKRAARDIAAGTVLTMEMLR